MDVEDEPNSYLKYLNDSDTPNTYLLGNNEVGLFSVEPIFTEMEATDWPQEGFPLLLNNSLMTEDSAEDQDVSSQSSDKNLVNETLHESEISDNLPETIEKKSTDIKNIEVQQIIEIPSIKNEVQSDDNALPLGINSLDLGQEQLQLKHEDTQLNEHCTSLDGNETNTQLHKNQSQNNDILSFNKNDSEITGNPELDKNYTVIQIPNEKYILVYGNNAQEGSSKLKFVSNGKAELPNKNSLLKLVNLPVTEKSQSFIQKKTKSVNDLFSTVVANKCKICAFLCEDLEQIKRHISEKHREFLFTYNGISNGVSLLISNAQKKVSQNNEVKKEFTVFVCSECHAVCTDKSDLKQHMIEVHHLTMEQAKSSNNTEPEVEIQESKPVYKETTFLSDVNISLVKKQEKVMQKIKCKVVGCTATFPTEDLCNTHIKLHLGDTKNLFKCQECEETFLMWRIARSHMYKEHGLDFGMIVCPMCSIFKSYKTAKILRHMMIHTEQKPFVCQECGKSFKQLAQLKNHEILHKTPEDMPTWCKVKRCDKCQRFFANSKSLKSHILSVHENFKPFICNICGHKAARKAMLEFNNDANHQESSKLRNDVILECLVKQQLLHLRQHTGSKPHKCDRCTYRTGDPNCLRKHMMKHVGAVTYQCPYCPYRCIQAGSIKSHLKHKHKGRTGTFSCKYCPYTTINPTSLHSHEKNHELSLMEGASSENSTAIERERRTETDLQMDEETQSCFLNTESQIEDTVDNGGITIPAGLEMPLVTQ